MNRLSAMIKRNRRYTISADIKVIDIEILKLRIANNKKGNIRLLIKFIPRGERSREVSIVLIRALIA